MSINHMKKSLSQYFDISERNIQSFPRVCAVRAERFNGKPEMFRVARIFRPSNGFSLLEIMVALAIFLVITGAVFSAMSTSQRASQGQQLKADMYLNLRGATELMAQEIGQAGLVSLPSPAPTLSGIVTGSSTAQAVTVSSATSMFVGEKLLIDAGGSQELVSLTAVNPGSNQITAVFNKSHSSGAVINALGVFPDGVLNSSTATQLQLFGDLNADGSLVYVHYNCDTTAGTLTRSITTVTPSVTTSNASQVMLSHLIANPGGTPCFQYTTQQVSLTQTLGTGVGTQTTFMGAIANVPISAGTVSIHAGSVTGTDNGSGSISGGGISSGTVNYTTGAISVTFAVAPSSGTAVTVTSTWSQVLVTNVAITLSVQTSTPDPQTRVYLTMTKSLLNLAPRNVLTSLELATVPFADRLQPTPPNLPLS
jgi:prepilin-type N-terminal cleavage/methylation domain-containing protein